MINKFNDEIVKNVLNKTFFQSWRNEEYKNDKWKYENYRKLEIMITGACDLKCKYCYYTRYGNQLYPPSIRKPSLITKNLKMLFEYLEQNNLFPWEIDLFSGEPFATQLGFDALEIMVDFYRRNNIEGRVVIPTNFSFLFDEKKTQQVIDLKNKGESYNIDIILSASIDGKYIEAENRPFRDGKIRTDEYYDKVFKFAKDYKCGFHPMVYSNGIEKWIDNFLWFQEQFEKHGNPWLNLYLLEVRNVEWTKQQLKEFYKFIRFVVKWSYHKSNIKPEDFPAFVHKRKLFNLFTGFSRIGRGTGCSIQSTIQLRVGDLTALTCHRTGYKAHKLWKFIVEDDKIVDIQCQNLDLFMTWASANTKNFPYCETCMIKNFCSGQCWGSMFETNSSPFIPIPTVCALEHAKMSAIMDELEDLGLWQYFYDFTFWKETIKLYREMKNGI